MLPPPRNPPHSQRLVPWGCPRAGPLRTCGVAAPGSWKQAPRAAVPLGRLLPLSHPGPPSPQQVPPGSHLPATRPPPFLLTPPLPFTGLRARAPCSRAGPQSPARRPALTCSVPGPPSSTTQTMGILMATPRTKHEPRIRERGTQTLHVGPAPDPPAGDLPLVLSGFQRLTRCGQRMICPLYVLRANSSPETARPPRPSAPFLGVQRRGGLSASEAAPTSLLSSAPFSWRFKSAHAAGTHQAGGREAPCTWPGAPRGHLCPLCRRAVPAPNLPPIRAARAPVKTSDISAPLGGPGVSGPHLGSHMGPGHMVRGQQCGPRLSTEKGESSPPARRLPSGARMPGTPVLKRRCSKAPIRAGTELGPAATRGPVSPSDPVRSPFWCPRTHPVSPMREDASGPSSARSYFRTEPSFVAWSGYRWSMP